MHYSEEDKIKINDNFNYLFTYDKNDILLEKKILRNERKKYFRIQCEYCKREFDVRSDYKIKKCKYCCNCYENSFAHYLEIELKLNINDVWDFELNNKNPYLIYKSTHDKIWIKCSKHGSYISDPGHFKGDNKRKGTRCPKCANELIGIDKKFTYEYIKEYIESFGYKILSKKYNGINDYIILQCPFEHEPYKATFHNFKNHNRRCPHCDISKGELIIMNWLKEHNIEYIYEKTFDDLLGISGGKLSYDFYLPKHNLLIEYQGEYHDGSVSNQTKEQFERQQEHDRRKRIYAIKNNIKLLEIWYWDFDSIEEILKEVLQEDECKKCNPNDNAIFPPFGEEWN